MQLLRGTAYSQFMIPQQHLSVHKPYTSQSLCNTVIAQFVLAQPSFYTSCACTRRTHPMLDSGPPIGFLSSFIIFIQLLLLGHVRRGHLWPSLLQLGPVLLADALAGHGGIKKRHPMIGLVFPKEWTGASAVATHYTIQLLWFVQSGKNLHHGLVTACQSVLPIIGYILNPNTHGTLAYDCVLYSASKGFTTAPIINHWFRRVPLRAVCGGWRWTVINHE